MNSRAALFFLHSMHSFLDACEHGDLAEAQRLVALGGVDMHANLNAAF
jgi:hypothetical protein